MLLATPHAKPRVTGPRVTRTEQCRPRAPSLRVRRSAGLGASVHEHGSESGNHRYRFCWSVGYKFTFCLPVPKLNASKRPLPGSQVHRLCSWPWGLGASAGCFEGTLAIVLILKFFFINCVRHGYRAVMYPAPKPYSGLCFLVFAPDLFPFGLSQREQRYPARGPWPPAPPTDARVRRHTPPLQGVGVWRHAPRHTFHSRTLRFLNTEERRALLF